MKTKICKTCRKRFYLTEFYKNYNYIDGLLPICKLCVSEYDTQRVNNHPGPKTTGTKICSFCKKEKLVNEYSKRLRSKDGLRNRCKTCDRQEEKKYRTRNPSQRYLAKIRQNYGLNEVEYKQLLIKQDYKCKICNEVKKLVVDHCHITLVVRGLLCQNCNAGLGMLQDNIDYLNNAIKYLKE